MGRRSSRKGDMEGTVLITMGLMSRPRDSAHPCFSCDSLGVSNSSPSEGKLQHTELESTEKCELW